jgi:hypothetical protein
MGLEVIDSFSGDYRFLSNFWYVPQKVIYDGWSYDTTEHAFQAAKTLSIIERTQIKDARSPGIAKRLGKLATMRSDWESIKVSVMADLLKQKFKKGTDLAELLDLTGNAQLIEGNTWNDCFWGVCRGKGQNVLGRLLMKVREENRK